MKRLSALAAITLATLSLSGCDPQGMNRANTDVISHTPPPQAMPPAAESSNSGLQRLLNVNVRLSRDASRSRNADIQARLDPITVSRAKMHSRSEVTAADQLVAVGLDGNGEEVYRQVVKDPLEFEAEVFDPNTGALESNQVVEKDNALLRLKIPERLRVEQLVLYRVTKTEQGFELDRVKEVQLVLTPESEQPKFNLRSMSDTGVFEVMNHGDSENRVDLVVVAEGYTRADLQKFEQDVQTIVDGYFSADVYREYEPLFNVWRVEVASNQSGAGQGTPKDTRFGAHFGCYNIQRLLCVDENEVLDYLDTVLPANAIDKVLVVVNTETYGGAGGQVATMSLAPQAIDLALHELGHSFAHLADEYDYGSCRMHEPNEANVTTDPRGAKWSHWFDRASNIGVYEGGRYCKSGMFRPSYTSMMKDLGQPFYAVNESQIVRSIYEYVDLLDTSSPSHSTINLTDSETQGFTVAPVQNRSGTAQVSWYLNDQKIHQGTSYEFNGAEHAGGTYTLKAMGVDTTDRVIKDPDGLLTANRTWTIALSGSGQSCDQAPVTPTDIGASEIQGNQFRLSWRQSQGARTYTVQKWSGYNWYELQETENTSLSLTAGVSGNTDYFRVFAENECGSSAATNWISVQYPSCTAKPDQPTGLQAQNVQSTQYTLTWMSVDGAKGYSVEVWNGYDHSWDTLQTTQEASIQIGNLTAGTVQYVRVVANNACGESQATPYIRVQTPG